MIKSRILTSMMVGLVSLPCLAQERTAERPQQNEPPAARKEERAPGDARTARKSSAPRPPAGGADQSMRMPEGPNAWAIRILSQGGFTGRGRGDLEISSDGYRSWQGPPEPCAVELSADSLAELSEVVTGLDSSAWTSPAASPCFDCYVTTMVLRRREQDGIERIYTVTWDDPARSDLSESVRKMYDAVIARKGCRG